MLKRLITLTFIFFFLVSPALATDYSSVIELAQVSGVNNTWLFNWSYPSSYTPSGCTLAEIYDETWTGFTWVKTTGFTCTGTTLTFDAYTAPQYNLIDGHTYHTVIVNGSDAWVSNSFVWQYPKYSTQHAFLMGLTTSTATDFKDSAISLLGVIFPIALVGLISFVLLGRGLSWFRKYSGLSGRRGR